jgi:OOP family OmpA-OmpF porin
MKTWRMTAAGAVLLLLAQPAFAEDAGFYLGGSIGQAEHSGACSSAVVPCDEKDGAWKLFAGYQFNRHLAVEFGYADLGASSASGQQSSFNSSGTFEVTAWELVAVGAFPVMDRLSVFGKAGLFRGEAKGEVIVVSSGGSVFSESRKESNTDLTFGLGVRYDVTRNLGVRAEWQRYLDVGGGELVSADVDVFSLGFQFRF